jgi:hypothetical protein
MGPDAGANLQQLGCAGGKQGFYLSAYLQQQQQHDMAWTQHEEHWPQPPPPKRYFQQGTDFLLCIA